MRRLEEIKEEASERQREVEEMLEAMGGRERGRRQASEGVLWERRERRRDEGKAVHPCSPVH